MASKFEKTSPVKRDHEVGGYRLLLTFDASGVSFQRIGGKREKTTLTVSWEDILEIGAEKQGVSAYTQLGIDE